MGKGIGSDVQGPPIRFQHWWRGQHPLPELPRGCQDVDGEKHAGCAAQQTEVVFLPQSYLPKVPRVVDLQAYETKKKSLSVKLLGFLGMKKGREDAANALGNIAERDIAEKLQNFFVKFAS